MQQHNPQGASQYCWNNTARERARLKARYAIRERVLGPDTNRSNTPHVKEENLADSDIRVDEILRRILNDDKSFFSLRSLDENLDALVSPFVVDRHVWREPTILRGELKLTSWFGKTGVDEIRHFFSGRKTMTPMEYALLFQRYGIVSSMLPGGVSPALRGSFHGDDLEDEWLLRLEETSARVLRRFFVPVPLPLGTYIAKRAFELRLEAWRKQSLFADVVCRLCDCKIPKSMQLYFACDHHICEPCFWESLLDRLDHRSDDVVVCPVCETPACPLQPIFATDEDKRGRYLEAKQRYLNLPVDSNALKAKKVKSRRRPTLAKSWSEAVAPSLGNSQDSRRDKFFVYVEKGLFHYVRGCLVEGIDLNLQNEYGQTGLSIAALFGHTTIVQMLLENGADPFLCANDGSTTLDAATSGKHLAVANLLQSVGAKNGNPLPTVDLSIQNVDVTTLIPIDEMHAGAGSFILDGTLQQPEVHTLKKLWAELPLDTAGKQKYLPCSVRSYYYDVQGFVRGIILRALESTSQFKTVDAFVFPSMRYLCYGEKGAVLAPHVDLARLDPTTRKRSTHSFLLYLTTCESGGETSLLRALGGSGPENVTVRVKPQEGRLLLFPHQCPHEGTQVDSVPKLLIRGEINLDQLMKNKQLTESKSEDKLS